MFDNIANGNNIIAETVGGDHIINEAILMDEGSNCLSEDNAYELHRDGIISEVTIIKIDKQSKRQGAINKACLVLAKEANDPDFKKLIKISEVRQKLISKMRKKYYSQAKARVSKNKRNIKSKKSGAKAIARSKKSSISRKDL